MLQAPGDLQLLADVGARVTFDLVGPATYRMAATLPGQDGVSFVTGSWDHVVEATWQWVVARLPKAVA